MRLPPRIEDEQDGQTFFVPGRADRNEEKTVANGARLHILTLHFRDTKVSWISCHIIHTQVKWPRILLYDQKITFSPQSIYFLGVPKH